MVIMSECAAICPSATVEVAQTLYTEYMGVGCSLEGSTASTILKWHGLHTHITYDFSQLSQMWGNICGGNSAIVQPYVHPQQVKVLKHYILNTSMWDTGAHTFPRYSRY